MEELIEKLKEELEHLQLPNLPEKSGAVWLEDVIQIIEDYYNYK